MKYDLDTEIRYPNGKRAGILRKVVMNDKNEVGVVIMATDQFISRDVIVPASMLYEGDGGVTYIDAEPNAVEGLRDYEEGEVPAVPEGWEFSNQASALGEVFPATVYQPIIPVMEVSNVSGAALTISQGTEIWCLDEYWGVVDEVTSDDSGNLQAFVGMPDSVEGYRYLIPIDLIVEADANRVVLNCTAGDLPTYAQEVVNEQKEPEVE